MKYFHISPISDKFSIPYREHKNFTIRFILKSARDKTLWMYDGLSHAITYKKEIYEILIRVQGWVLARLDRS